MKNNISEMDEESRKSLYSSLLILDCPFIQNLDKWSLVDILFTPNLTRLSLLNWIFDKWNSCLDENFTESTSTSDVDVNKLHNFSVSVGLCQPSEIDVIKGTATAERQLSFWNLLLLLIINKYNLRKDSSSVYKSFKDGDAPQPSVFLHDIAENMVLLKPLFESKVNLFSSEIEKLIKVHTKKFPKPSKDFFNEQFTHSHMKEMNEEISSLKQSTNPNNFSENISDIESSTLNCIQNMKNLHDSCRKFDTVFKNEMKQWMKNEKSQHSFQKSESLLQSISQEECSHWLEDDESKNTLKAISKELNTYLSNENCMESDELGASFMKASENLQGISNMFANINSCKKDSENLIKST